MALLLLPAAAGGDEVHLTNGGVVSGVIVESTPDAVVIETGPGRVTLSRSRIARVVESRSALALFQEQAAGLAPDDVEGLARLARWAVDQGLATQARETWRRVLGIDPDHPEANAALGRVSLDGVWMDESEAYRAQGYVRYRGRWVTPAEHEALLRERESEELAAADRREAEVRLREAEARAREAEARAREAEAQADQAEDTPEGIPYWWVLAGGGPIWTPGWPYPRPPRVRPEHRIVRPPYVQPHDSSTGTIRGNPTRPPGGRHQGGSGGSTRPTSSTRPAPSTRPAGSGGTGTIRN
jgi:hypothetical protein